MARRKMTPGQRRKRFTRDMQRTVRYAVQQKQKYQDVKPAKKSLLRRMLAALRR